MKSRGDKILDQIFHALAAANVIMVAELLGPPMRIDFGPALWIAASLWAVREFTEWQLQTRVRKIMFARRPPQELIGRGRPWSAGSLIDLAGWLSGAVIYVLI